MHRIQPADDIQTAVDRLLTWFNFIPSMDKQLHAW